jgi:hypothetical protein
MPRHRTHFLRTDGQPRGSLTASSSAAPKNPIFTSLFSEATDNGSTDNENVSRKSENPKIVVDDGEDSQMRNLAFDDVAESPAPPLNYEKYLTMQVGSGKHILPWGLPRLHPAHYSFMAFKNPSRRDRELNHFFLSFLFFS